MERIKVKIPKIFYPRKYVKNCIIDSNQHLSTIKQKYIMEGKINNQKNKMILERFQYSASHSNFKEKKFVNKQVPIDFMEIVKSNQYNHFIFQKHIKCINKKCFQKK